MFEVKLNAPGPLPVLPPELLALLFRDDATDEDEVGEVSKSEADDDDGDKEDEDDDEELVESLAKEIFASVVRPQFGSTSSAKLLICVVILCLLELLFELLLSLLAMLFVLLLAFVV